VNERDDCPLLPTAALAKPIAAELLHYNYMPELASNFPQWLVSDLKTKYESYNLFCAIILISAETTIGI
jgi:hypothetical protein